MIESCDKNSNLENPGECDWCSFETDDLKRYVQFVLFIPEEGNELRRMFNILENRLLRKLMREVAE